VFFKKKYTKKKWFVVDVFLCNKIKTGTLINQKKLRSSPTIFIVPRQMLPFENLESQISRVVFAVVYLPWDDGELLTKIITQRFFFLLSSQPVWEPKKNVSKKVKNNPDLKFPFMIYSTLLENLCETFIKLYISLMLLQLFFFKSFFCGSNFFFYASPNITGGKITKTSSFVIFKI